MANNPIRLGDHIIDDTLESIIEKLERANVQIDEMDDANKRTATSFVKELKTKGVSSLEEIIDRLRAANAELDRMVGLNKQAASSLVKELKKASVATSKQREEVDAATVATDKLAKAEAALKASKSEVTKELIKLKTEQTDQNRITRLTNKLNKSAEGSYDRLSAQYSLNKIELNKMSEAQRSSTSSGQKLENQTREIYEEMNRLQKATGKAQLQVGQYDRFMGGAVKTGAKFLASVTGAVFAIRGLFTSLATAVQTYRDFEDTNKVLNSILGETSKSTAELRNQQLDLGKSTEFSASQVAKAQTELARLGVTQENIIRMTPGILSAATALGTDLAGAAELVAGQLNAFGKSADESQNVADVLTKTTQISAFNFEKLKTALAIVSPAANAVNVSLERQNAILGAAADANIDASSAATALRNIFIDLGDQGLTWEDAMFRINNSTDKLTAANDLFGKRGAVVASVIANNTEKIDRNTEALENAEGTAKRFAEEQLQSLTGDLKIANSAWEGFILGIEKGDGALAKFARGAVQTFTKLLEKITPELENQTSALELQRQEFNDLVTVLTDLNPTQDETRSIISKLNSEYGDYLPNLITEKTSKEELINIQKRVNDELLNTIVLRQQEEELMKVSETQIAFAKQIQDLLVEQSKLTSENREIESRAFESRAQAIQNDNSIDFNKTRIVQIGEEINRLRDLVSAGIDVKSSLKREADALREILGINEDQNEISKALIDNSAKAKKASEEAEKAAKKAAKEAEKEAKELEQHEKQKLSNAEKSHRLRLSQGKELIEQTTDLTLSEIDLLQTTEDEKTKLRLEAEKDRLEALIRLNEVFGGDLSNLQIEQMQNVVSAIESEIKDIQDGGFPDIYEALGLKLTDEQKESTDQSVQYIKDSLTSILNDRLEIINAAVESSESELDVARTYLDEQLALAREGRDADVEGARENLEDKRDINQRAIEQQRKAQRQQQIIQDAQTISSIVTASANIIEGWSSVPFVGSVLGIAAVGTMIAAFATSKAKARKVSSFGEGGDFDIEGGSHSSGNDVSLGVHNGTEMRVEGGEKAAIFSRSSIKRYGGSRISEIVKSINRGYFQDKYGSAFSEGKEISEKLGINNYFDVSPIIEENKKLRHELKSVVKEIPQPIQNWDDKGYTRHLRRGNTTELNIQKENRFG